MKKLGGLLIATLVLAGFWLPAVPTSAAACANTSTYGAVNLDVPILPKAGSYLLWVRMQSPETSGKVLVEANGRDCLEVGSTTLKSDTWTWLAYQWNGQNQPVEFSHTEDNRLKVIGIQAGIKVDRVLLTEPDCVPQDFGDNCGQTIEAFVAEDGIVALPPPSDGPVRGNVTLSNTPFTQANGLAELSYIAGGRTVQTSDHAESFDTTRLKNGKYTVIIETKLKDGKTIRESTVINIDNPENILTPIMRWLKLNFESIKLIGIILGVLVTSGLLLWLARKTYLKRRERHFHGF